MKPAWRLLLSLAATALALLAAEGVLRFARPDIGRRGFVDAELGWASAEYEAFDPRAGARDPAKLRALFLGDSYLAGVNVRQMEERFPSYLEASEPERIDTQILASAGWGPDQELLAFVEKGAAWEPDVVVLAFCANNDLLNLLTNGRGGSTKPYYVLDGDDRLTLHDAAGAPRALPGGTGETRSVSQVYLLDLVRSLRGGAGAGAQHAASAVDPRYLLYRGVGIDTVLVDVMERRPRLEQSPQLGVTDISAYIHEDFEINAYQWRLCEAVLGELRDRVEAAGARLVVMLLPTPYLARDTDLLIGSGFEQRFETPDGPFTFRIDEPRARLAAACSRLGVDFFDPTPQFRQRILAEDLVERCWPDEKNRHFSRVGHFLLAEQLREYLLD